MLRALAPASTLGLAAIAVLGVACSPSVQPPPTITIAAVDPASVPAPSIHDVDPTRPRPAPATIAWETVERDAREKARRLGQPLLVFVRADWDAASTQMERVVWKDARLAAAVKSFVALRLDVTDTDGDAQAFAERYGVNAVPEIVVVDAAGRITGRASGFSDAAQILELVRRASD